MEQAALSKILFPFLTGIRAVEHTELSIGDTIQLGSRAASCDRDN